MDLYQRICDSNIKKYGTESEKYLEIIINQYSNRTHFIYEILQNAEDEGATRIHFHLKKDRLEIIHNGDLFDEKDVDGVCGIANGTKNNDGTRIGHFGIGFKSVYCYTSTPKIYSGDFHFLIEKHIFPKEIKAITSIEKDETLIVIPFDKEEVPCSIAFKEIKNALNNEITEDSVLILNNIKDILISVDGEDKDKSINIIKNQIGKVDNGYVYSLGTSLKQADENGELKEKTKDFLMFADNGDEQVALVFRIGGKDNRQILKINNSKIYAFFPTAREAHQNFYIHAPFDTTPARDNFKGGGDYGAHNEQLVEQICGLITSSFLWMRDKGYLSFASFNTAFPVYEYEKSDILHAIYENSIDIISAGYDLLPTNQPGVYKEIENICVPRWSNIVDVFSDDDLHKLVSTKKYWITKEISYEASIDLYNFLKQNFDLKIYDWEDLVLKMDAPFLSQKDIEWMEGLVTRIESYCTKRGNSKNYINAISIPFIRTDDGKQVCARDENGNLQVYLNNHSSAKYKINKNYLENEAIYSFYRNALQVVDYDIELEVKTKILPKYAFKNVKVDINENIKDLKAIKEACHSNPFILKQLQDKYLVSDGADWHIPSELYVRSNSIRSGYSLLKGTREFKYISDDYARDFKLDEDFFKTIGCNTTIKVVYVSKGEYLNTIEKYLGLKERISFESNIFDKKYISDKFNWQFTFEGFSSLFKDMNFEKSLSISKFLNANKVKFDIKGEIIAANDQNFDGKSVDNVNAFSMIGLYLCHEKWLYVKNSDKPVRPMDINRDDLRSEYQKERSLLDALYFKQADNTTTQYVNANYSDQKVKETVADLLNRPEELEKAAKAYAKNRAKESAKANNKSLKDMIEGGDVKQAESKQRDDEFEVPPISESGIKKRTENIDKIFSESMDFKTYVAHGLRFVNNESNKEERQFLLSQYNGKCQICNKQIIKHDGEEYFEAINIIKFSDMNSKYVGSSELGWNSLCLCPNCAAEYTYCSKKISSLYDQVMNKEAIPNSYEPIEINIEVPEGKPKKIKYSPRHFIALKEALRIFSEE